MDLRCGMLQMQLMSEHTKCWAEMMSPAMGCSPPCTKVWDAFRTRYPHCSGKIKEEVVKSQVMAKGMADFLSHGQLETEVVRGVDEVCNDLTWMSGATGYG